MSAKQYRKNPVVVEAIRFDGSNAWEISTFIGREVGLLDDDNPDAQMRKLMIDTLEGTMIASYGDWIIRGVKGEFYPCKPDIFEAIYEPATRPASPGEKERELLIKLRGCFRAVHVDMSGKHRYASYTGERVDVIVREVDDYLRTRTGEQGETPSSPPSRPEEGG